MSHTGRNGAELFSAFQLPCGVRLKNRMVKSAMSDSLGDGAGNPTAAQIRLYEKWAEGGAAAALVGEVQCVPTHPEKPGNLVLHAKADKALFAELTTRGGANGAQLWAQLGNAGALTHPPIGIPKGPSALNFPELSCAEFSAGEVADLPRVYARAAAQARELGFGGVQIHAAHGFLLSEFLSPLFNRRTDAYGGSANKRMRTLVETAEAVRAAAGGDFPVALKINASDQLEGGLTEEESLKIVAALDGKGLDLIDISGGTYFPGAKNSSDRRSDGPYFLEYARRARKITSVPLMATGGFTTRQQAADAVASGAVDFVGLARALALAPSLPAVWQKNGKDPTFPRFDSPPKGGITAWYTMRLTEIGEERAGGADLDAARALREYDARDKKRESIWNEKFRAQTA